MSRRTMTDLTQICIENVRVQTLHGGAPYSCLNRFPTCCLGYAMFRGLAGVDIWIFDRRQTPRKRLAFNILRTDCDP